MNSVVLAALIFAPAEPEEVRKEATYYYSDAYAPLYLLRSRPWQGIAVDSKGLVYVAQPYATAAGNRSLSAAQINIFDPQGLPVARFNSAPGWVPSSGIAVDEKAGRIYLAGEQQHVLAFDWRGPGQPLVRCLDRDNKPLVAAKKEGGRCVGVSLGRNGILHTVDMAENRVYRFYPAGGYSSFGSGPGGGEQGFNHIRRVFELPVSGNLCVLDGDGVRVFSPTGNFLKRIGKPVADGILAVAPDGTILAGGGKELVLLDSEGKTLKTFPPLPQDALDAALGNDGKFYVIPRGEEYCYAAYDTGGKLLLQRGADFDRLTVTLPSAALVSGKPFQAKVEFANALMAGLLSGAEKKVAEARPQSPAISLFVRSKDTPAWRKLAWANGSPIVLPAELQGAQTLRFTTAETADAAGPAVDVAVSIGR
jgi:hypothetical protein